MNGFLWAALVAAALAGVLLWRRHTAARSYRALVVVETSTTGALREVHAAAVGAAGAGAFSETVELVGTAQAGAAGLLRAPFSDAECVFFRSRVTRRYREVTHDSEGRRRTATREEVVSDQRSSEALVLRDADGEVPVLPARASFKALTKKVSRFVEPAEREGSTLRLGSFALELPAGRGADDTLGYEYEEWVIQPGTRLFVHGEATDADGELVVRAPRDGDDRLVVSQRSEEELLAGHARTVRSSTLLASITAGAAAVLLVVGLVVALT